METVQKFAAISEDGLYRYSLSRVWGDGINSLAFVMLNPSTADAEKDDPTIRKCVAIAKHNHFDRIVVVNLFAFRATDPKLLSVQRDPVGPDNDKSIREAVSGLPVVCAWGSRSKFKSPRLMDRPGVVRHILRHSAANICCLKETQTHDPIHPLFMPHDTVFVPF